MTNKKSKSKINKAITHRFQFRNWVDWSRIKAGGEYISKGAKQIFFHSPQRPTETFLEAQERMKLTDASLNSRGRALWRLSVLMTCLASALFLYSIYHLFLGTIHSAILTLALMLVSLAFAFRYHFWYFQITQHKLGCSFNDWFRDGLLGKKP